MLEKTTHVRFEAILFFKPNPYDSLAGCHQLMVLRGNSEWRWKVDLLWLGRAHGGSRTFALILVGKRSGLYKYNALYSFQV